MKGNVKLGVVCGAKNSFDITAATEIYGKIKTDLRAHEGVDWVIWDKLLVTIADAEEAGLALASELLDGVVIISGTFHMGHMPLIINSYVRQPVLLWALNELPYNGGKIRLNSVCGINLNASNYYKAGINGFCCNIADTISEEWLDAMRMVRAIKRAKIGISGYSAEGFFNVNVADLDLYRYADVLVDHFELSDLYQVSVMSEKDAAATARAEEIKDIFCCSVVSDDQVNKVASLSNSMMNFMNRKGLDALAVRCWPEFAATYGIAPCASMSYLQGHGYVIGCEGDIEGTLSMLAVKQISEDAPFMADLSQVNFEEDYALMWHCGVAPYTLWDNKSERSLHSYHQGGRGVTADFVMKDGDITFMRIDTARGRTRVFAEKGTVIPMTKDLRGTYCKVKFDKSIREIINTVTSTGIAHHVAMIYGDKMAAIRLFAQIKGFEMIE